jgi:uncharacterized iron-regulated membrane protein
MLSMALTGLRMVLRVAIRARLNHNLSRRAAMSDMSDCSVDRRFDLQPGNGALMNE